ncbi:MAG: MFS transporter [Tannerellaceae bacterium]|jgi:DHA3 family macrolide efflux protein-like MFS transporter|nr:MFS transporter [Tannerellaceae bacterium]
MDIRWKRNTALFITGQALSLFGTMVVQYAIMWHITLTTQSGAMMTLLTIAGFLPMFFISPFGGVWADRYNRKYIINIADGSIAFASLIMAVLIMSGIDLVGILLACAAIRSFGQGVQTPAVGAFIPQIVPQEHLTRINGLQSSIQSFIFLMAPMISAALMSFVSLEILFFLDVVTAAIGISLVAFFVKVPQGEKPVAETGEPKGNYWHDLREGIRYIKQHGYILQLMALTAVFLFFFAPASLLTPLQVIRNFGNDVWRLSAIEVGFSAGVMLGGILIGYWGGFKNRIYTMSLACLLCGLLVVGLGIAPDFWLYLAMMSTLGISFPLWNTPFMVLLQTTVEPAFMGRVFSVFSMISSTMMPLGMLIFGPVADTVSINILLVGTGLIVTLLAIPLIRSKTLREAGKA